jgi:hypothetical protein
MDIIAFNFKHKVRGVIIDVEVEVVSVPAIPYADSDWDRSDYFSIETVVVAGEVVEPEDMKTLELTDALIEKEFEAYCATRQEEFDCEEHPFTGC